jgi:hypothetical protein
MDDDFEMATTGDEHPVQTFTPDSSDKALSEGVGTGSFDRRANRADTFCPEDLVEAGGQFGIAIPDQVLDRSRTLGQFEAQVPGLLDYPGASGVSRYPGHVHPSGVEFDEEQDVEPPQKHNPGVPIARPMTSARAMAAGVSPITGSEALIDCHLPVRTGVIRLPADQNLVVQFGRAKTPTN